MFNGANSYANSVDWAMAYIISICVVLLVGITAFMLFFVIKYNKKRHPNPIQTHGSTALEVVWIVIPTIIVLSMFFVGIADYGVLRRTAKWDNLVKVNAYQWGWQYEYSNGFKTEKTQAIDLDAKDNIGANYKTEVHTFIKDTLFVPVGKTTKIEMISSDVLHSFYIPDFRIKEDVIPKKESFIILKPEKVGIHDIACTEYCGIKHSRMYSRLVVLSQEDYAKFLENTAPKKEEKKETTDAASVSKEVAAEKH
jgi:cytochrome c oxidase subunit 2